MVRRRSHFAPILAGIQVGLVAVVACSGDDASGPVAVGDAGADAATGDGPVACVPACAGRACGDDGCGGVCGTCTLPPFVCDAGKLTRYESTCPVGQCVTSEHHETCPVTCGTSADGNATCAGSNPKGVFDSANEDGLHGWACDPDTPWIAATVHVYVDKPTTAGGSAAAAFVADQASEPAVQTECNGGSHRFLFDPAAEKAAGIAPGLHDAWTYVLPTAVGEPPALLGGSPRTMPVAASAIDMGYTKGHEVKAITKKGGVTGGTYAYAPSIVRAGGEFHLFACNADGVHLGDSVGYVHSADGVTWSAPTTVLYMPAALQGVTEHTCDPSVVYAELPGGSQSYFYLFYSSYSYGLGTVNSVARSSVIGGPYAHFMGGDPTADASWVVDPGNVSPAFIQTPTVSCGSNPQCYGLGEPSVVYKDGTFYQWYQDSTATPSGIRMTKSTDAVHWSAPVYTGIGPDGSVDVKYDPSTKRFVMIDLVTDHAATLEVYFRSSADGVAWTTISHTPAPAYSSEPGMSGDERGYMHAGTTLIGFAAPYDLGTTESIPNWELFVTPVAVAWR